MLLFLDHEPQAHKGNRVKEPNRNCARFAFRFSSGAATVPSPITAENGFIFCDADQLSSKRKSAADAIHEWRNPEVGEACFVINQAE